MNYGHLIESDFSMCAFILLLCIVKMIISFNVVINKHLNLCILSLIIIISSFVFYYKVLLSNVLMTLFKELKKLLKII